MCAYYSHLSVPGPVPPAVQKFVEVGPGEDGIPALSIKDVQEMFNIPYFDFVKIDIEGELSLGTG